MDVLLHAGAPAAPWAVGAVVTGCLVVRTAATAGTAGTGRDRGTWVVVALAAVLLSAGELTRLAAGAPVVPPWWGLAAGTGAVALLYAAHMRLLNERLRAHAPGAVLDTIGGAAMYGAVVCALLAEPLWAARGVDQAQAALLLARTAAGLLLLGFAATTVVIGRRTREPRSWSLWAAAAVSTTVDGAQVWGVLDASAAGPVADAVGPLRMLVPVLLLLGALAPAPPALEAQVEDEDAPIVLLGPLAFLAHGGVVLAAAHVVHVPTSAVIAAVVCLVVVGVKVVVVFARVTTLNASRREAMTDELTGLGNRRALGAAMAPVDAGRPVALVLVDLDGFKEVNDALGHAAGDELLQQVAGRMRASTTPGELVARQGGDEFAVVLPGLDASAAAARARHLVAHLGEPYLLTGRQVVVTASAGVCAAPGQAGTAEDLLRRADAAMYRAKTTGGGVVVHDHEVEAERREHLHLAVELRRAVAAGQLEVHYQPQVESVTGRVVGVEALVRWPHPVRGLLAPAAFLGLVEELGLMDALTEHVLGSALAEVAGWRGLGAGGGVRLAVNLSATTLRDPGLVDTVARALMTHGVAPEDLVLEVTETELMRDPAASHRVVSALVDLGVGVSIDDYGTGYSSLAYLRDLPATELKLDRSFVAPLTSDPRAAAIVRTTVDLAHSLGLRLVAEGVEDAATLDRLHQLGADVTQGYHHARPMPAAELTAWLAARPAPRAHRSGAAVSPAG